MKLSLALIAVAAPAVAAVSPKKVSLKKRPISKTDLPAADINAQSRTGNRLLSKARRLDGGEEAQTWVANYSLKFDSCVQSADYYGGYFADQNENQNNYGDGNGNYDGQYNANYQNGDNGNNQYNSYYNNEQRNDYQGVYEQKLVKFKLCPSDSSCWSCKNGAEYVVELGEYVDAVLEAQMSAQEYACENVRENCNCEDAYSDEQCEYSCFENAGLTSCADAEVEGEFDLQAAVECTEVEVDETIAQTFYANELRASNSGNQYYSGEDQADVDAKLYVGPYCSANGKKILLGAFREETCSFKAPDGLYEATNYGTSLPNNNLVDNKCISCKVPQTTEWANYYEQEQEAPEVTEVCAALYESAGKCEEGLTGYVPYRDTMGCTFIQSLKSPSGIRSALSFGSKNVTAGVFAGLFAATTAALAALSLVLYKRNQRQNVSLVGGDAIIA